jgi:hypothetical protein
MKKKPTHGTGDRSRQNLPDDPEQSKRFEETARELGVDESGKRFEEALKVVRSPNTKSPPPAKPKAGKSSKST